VKAAEATSANAVIPVTVIVYNPAGGDEPTVNNPLTVPVVLTEHDEAVARVPPTPSATPPRHGVGPPALKPDPEMTTTVVAGPKVGFSARTGTTENPRVLDAVSPNGVPLTVNE
jgi:hypothetical protein